MSVLFLSAPKLPPPALTAAPEEWTAAQFGNFIHNWRLRRTRPGAVVCVSPAAQLPGPWPQIGLCATPDDASRYRAGTHLVAATECCARAIGRKGKQAVVLPLPIMDVASPLPATAPHLLVVAPLTRASCLDVFLKSLNRTTGLTITLAGQGPVRADLTDIAKYFALRVNFIDHASAEDYRRATLIVHPVRTDYDGAAIRAAHAAARPIIATATDAARELILPNETGMLVPPADSAALALSIQILLEDPAMAAAIAESGHDRHQRDCSRPLLQGRWRGYLEAVIQPKEPPHV